MSEEEFINPIDPDKITETPGTLPYAHHTGSALVKPEDKGKLKGLALSAMEYQTDMQMDQIYEQMKLLSDQANRLQDRKRISEYIYQAEMRFQPLINHTYYLYEKEDGSYFLSLIGPNDWGRSGDKFNYIATTKLLADHTWDVLNKSQEL
ncbi:MAG: DUF2452 domain-containing protein [Crocinitomicaceae bacterium]|jgi:hypothetical protein|nr:DUF2452 domain-containing protein [Crocinitomicaceae bacterium]MDG1859847.1 DUF2452 domain-containing protein [Emcibacteraceae bacterium]MDG2465142.1 DUF2452 domain-containing protein [Crocinitomicaceae bacterium]